MKEIAKALLSVQKALDPVHKGKSGYGYKYADLPAVMDACLEGLNSAGVVVVQAPMPSDKNVAVIHTRFIHAESGEEITGTIEIPFDASTKNMNAAQAYGSAMTYGRRYALVSMVGIVVDDDDGASAGRTAKAKKESELSPDDLARHNANAEKADKTIIKAHDALEPLDEFQRVEWVQENPKAVEALKWVKANFPEKMDKLTKLGVEV